MGAQWKAKGREAAAAARGRIFTKLSREIMVAARAGADPDMNPRLRLAVEQAKKASMPRETLERVIKKGAGLLSEGVNYEKLNYEGFAPHRVPVIALSGYGREQDRARSVEAGFAAHLVKPADPAEVHARLTDLLAPRRLNA